MKLVNRAKMTITAVASSGTGALTLGVASAGGFSTFAAAGVANADKIRYTIEGPGDIFEIGVGVYTSSGTTLSRTPSESSNADNSAITATTASVVFATAAAVDLGPALHTDIDGLIAQVGMTVGDTALVTGGAVANKLFMYTATGWFVIATISNAAPTAITGAAASYTLARDGTATVVTLVSTDPEGFPITFSHSVTTGSLGSTATVSQGTGSNTHVFTVTPSSTEAHAGTFSITWTAQDSNSSGLVTAISAFTLSFGFDLSTASYDSVSFSVASQEASPSDMAFNSSGTKMYVVGYVNDTVYQYSLSSAFDLSTASYDSVNFSVASQDTLPSGITFNTTGSKMYMVGITNDAVYQYSLSSAFNVGTASYDSVSFSVASQETTPADVAFNSSGTKMFMLGSTNDTAYQYSLSSAFDLSTASYDSVSFSVTSQAPLPLGLAFNTSGSKMYVVGLVNDTVYQYSV